MPITASKLLEKYPPLSPEKEKKQLAELSQQLMAEKDYAETWRSLFLFSTNTSKERAAIDALRQSDPTDFQQIAASQLDLSLSYYTSVRNQSEQSFLWSRITSGIGLAFFLVAAAFFIIRLENISYISAVSGALVEVYAGLIQWQGKRKEDQAKDYHVRLDRIQRFIIANSACEGLDGAEKQQKRSEIISKLVE